MTAKVADKNPPLCFYPVTMVEIHYPKGGRNADFIM
ncbi:hypothetical protein Xbed_03051 [Xenorhabdus beddingii]|uniref:Uncharacterized protein n=1 Tax=Xenorhabdus beddingii TaxID=40578 RepID=A0A1Y2SM75_9GAMM|nr:hypothetical protein Xbed_03051 [Xenorhabdus beddingii]